MYNMNKTVLASMAVAALLAGTSCDNDKGNNMEQTFGVQMLNLVTDMNVNGASGSEIAETTYRIHIDYTDTKIGVGGVDVPVGNEEITFSVSDTRYNFDNFMFHASALTAPTSGGGEIKGFDVRLTQAFNQPPVTATHGSPAFKTTMAMMAYYTYGHYMVRTFPADAVYTGYTTATLTKEGDADNHEYTTDKPMYRVIINASTMTASLFIYNARFSDSAAAPDLNLRIDGLKVRPTNLGYEVVGTDVVPCTMAEGTPYPSFTFATFRMSNLSDDLTTAKIEFSISNERLGTCAASFQGKYLIDTSVLQ